MYNPKWRKYIQSKEDEIKMAIVAFLLFIFAAGFIYCDIVCPEKPIPHLNDGW